MAAPRLYIADVGGSRPQASHCSGDAFANPLAGQPIRTLLPTSDSCGDLGHMVWLPKRPGTPGDAGALEHHSTEGSTPAEASGSGSNGAGGNMGYNRANTNSSVATGDSIASRTSMVSRASMAVPLGTGQHPQAIGAADPGAAAALAAAVEALDALAEEAVPATEGDFAGAASARRSSIDSTGSGDGGAGSPSRREALMGRLQAPRCAGSATVAGRLPGRFSYSSTQSRSSGGSQAAGAAVAVGRSMADSDAEVARVTVVGWPLDEGLALQQAPLPQQQP